MTREAIIAALSALSIEDLSAIRLAADAEINAKFAASDESCGISLLERSEIKSGNLIGCVKLIRERTGLGLRESKDIMDRVRVLMGEG